MYHAGSKYAEGLRYIRNWKKPEEGMPEVHRQMGEKMGVKSGTVEAWRQREEFEMPTLMALMRALKSFGCPDLDKQWFRELLKQNKILNDQEASRYLDNLLASDLFILKADTQKPYEPKMVSIPAGEFWMGDDDLHTRDSRLYSPRTKVKLEGFQVSIYPILVQEYLAFLQDKLSQPPPESRQWNGRNLGNKFLNFPVTGISWFDTNAYCNWLSEKTNKKYRLLTEAEWEYAARGPRSCIYPWGDESPHQLCNTDSSLMMPVDQFPKNMSEFGCMDLVGNTFEWVSTLWGDDWRRPSFDSSYNANDGRERIEAQDFVLRVLKSGSWKSYDELNYRCAFRTAYLPTARHSQFGSRIAMTI